MTDSRSALLDRLARHHPLDADETRALARLSAFVERTAEPFTRATLEGHVTASAVVLGPDGRALLLLHGKLGIWVQPGGHLEPGETPPEGALREAREESGLPDLALALAPDGTPLLLDVDVHPIPESPKRGEPAHHHHDLCYLARTAAPADARIDAAESRALRWVNAHEASLLPLDAATRRRLAKAFAFTR